MKIFILIFLPILLLSYKRYNNTDRDDDGCVYSNYNSFNKHIHYREGDSLFLEVFQGVSISGKTYINWTYKSKSDSLVFLVERASEDLRFKKLYIKLKEVKRANILLCQSFIDSTAGSNSINYYRLKVFSFKKINPECVKRNISHPIIRVEPNKSNVPFLLKQ